MTSVVIQLKDGRATVRGTPACEFGHRLPDTAGYGPDGVFAGWAWDGARLRAWTDRYGAFPIFYYVKDGELGLSSSLVELIQQGAPTDFDLPALFTFRRLGFYLGDNTPFQAIKALPPGCRLEWDGRLQIAESRSLAGHLDLTWDEAVDGFVTVFREAVRTRLTDEPFALPLSGGLDSRHILLELTAAGARPSLCLTTWHYDPGGKTDAEVAASIAAELGLRHVTVQRIPRFEAESRKNVATHFCAVMHAWYVPVADYLRQHAEVSFDGLLGGVISAGRHQHDDALSLFREGRYDRVAALLLQGELEPGVVPLDPVYGHGDNLTYEEINDLCRERIAVELRRYEGAANPLTQFSFWNFGRRQLALAPYGVMAAVPIIHTPYLDHRVWDFLLSLPSEMPSEQFHVDAIARADPRFGRFPYSVDRDEPRRRLDYARFATQVAAFGAKTRPRRTLDLARTVYQAARLSAGGAYGRTHTLAGGRSTLYLWQLENLAAGRPLGTPIEPVHVRPRASEGAPV